MVRLKEQEMVAFEKRVSYSQALRVESALPREGHTGVHGGLLGGRVMRNVGKSLNRGFCRKEWMRQCQQASDWLV